MRMRLTVGTSLAIALLVGSVHGAEALKSGPQVGDGVPVFEPLNVTGSAAGRKQCPV